MTSIKPKLCAYTIVQRERDGQKFWVRIGEAHDVRPDQIEVRLDALPVNGVIVLRPFRQGLAGLLPRAGDLEPAEVIPASVEPIPPPVTRKKPCLSGFHP